MPHRQRQQYGDDEGSYLTAFHRLRCAGDILNAIGPKNNLPKEIKEAMAFMRKLRSLALALQNGLFVDLCAGHCLLSVTAVHLFKGLNAIAVDKEPSKTANFSAVQRFTFVKGDINHPWIIDYLRKKNTPQIIAACHACGDLSERVIEIYKQVPQAIELLLLPCCEVEPRRQSKLYPFWANHMGKYAAFACHLATKAEGTVKVDYRCGSPCNHFVHATKEVVRQNLTQTTMEVINTCNRQSPKESTAAPRQAAVIT